MEDTTLQTEVFPCHWAACCLTYMDVEALYSHLCNDHVGRGKGANLVCQYDDCQNTYTKRDHLTSHLRIHVPLKPHSCPVCSRAFKRPQDLKKHEKLHESGGIDLDGNNAETAETVKAARRNLVRKGALTTKKESKPVAIVREDSTLSISSLPSTQPHSPTESSHSINSESLMSTVSGTNSKKRRASTEINGETPPHSVSSDPAAAHNINRFFNDIKRNRFSPGADSADLKFELEGLSKYIVTTPIAYMASPSLSSSTPPPMAGLLPLATTTTTAPISPTGSGHPLESFTNQDLVSIDDFLNSLAGTFNEPAIGYGIGGSLMNSNNSSTSSSSSIMNEPKMNGFGSGGDTGIAGSTGMFDSSAFMFQNPATGSLIPYQSIQPQLYQQQQQQVPQQYIQQPQQQQQPPYVQSHNSFLNHQQQRPQHFLLQQHQSSPQQLSHASQQPQHLQFPQLPLQSLNYPQQPQQQPQFNPHFLPRNLQTSTPQMAPASQRPTGQRAPYLPSFTEFYKPIVESASSSSSSSASMSLLQRDDSDEEDTTPTASTGFQALMDAARLSCDDMDVDVETIGVSPVDVTLPVPDGGSRIILPPPVGMLLEQQKQRVDIVGKRVVEALKELVKREMEVRVQRQLGFM
ncbi:UNVERIFIED_CONTAM: hypothetical protein HDU68_001083 [Siphonaria sp. JEL0065]|nr:hypothetical protein HDU68_001083 [Siphonaria sp. JEL0065]